MEIDEEQNGASETIPEFGAIFMSNAATRKECFKRKLFGLPPRWANFVKQVKTGTMLFLFEFETRQLYGVFRASCNGAMNIVPNAFSSFGYFPAQVKFVPIWLCRPLREDEFYDAIKENYFSPKKFHFGLSKDQVHRLLSLFSWRKFKDMPLDRQFGRSQFTRPTGYSKSKVRKRVDGGRLFLTDAVEDDHNLDHCCRVNSKDYPRESFRDDGRFARSALSEDESKINDEFGLAISNDHFGKFGRVLDGDWFASTDEMGNECNIDSEYGSFISTKYPGYALHEIERVADDFVFGTSERQYDKENVIEPPASIELPGLPPLVTNSLVDDHNRTSPTVHYQMRPHITRRSFSKAHGHVVPPISDICYSSSFGSSAIPYEPDAPSFRYKMSSSHLVDCSSNSPQKHAPPQNCYVRKISPTLENQSPPLHIENKVTSNCLDCKSCLGNNASLPYLNSHGDSYRTSVPFMDPAYSENRLKRYDENEGSTGCVRHSSLSFPPFPEEGNDRRTDEEPSNFFSPIKPSARFESSYPVASKQEHVRKIPCCEDDDSFVVNVPTSKEVHFLRQYCSVNGRDISYHEFSSVNDDIHQNSDGTHCGSNKRNSVFSRLALAPEKIELQNHMNVVSYESGEGRSVDELMAMLHQSRQEQVKTESSRPSFRRLDRVTNSITKKQISLNPKVSNICAQKLPRSTKINAIPADKENPNCVLEGTPFVDFKRRSELQKTHVDSKTGGSNASAENDGSLGGHHNKRKLIRPNFSKSDSSNDKDLHEDTIQNIQPPDHESNVYPDNTRGCDALMRSLDCKLGLSQNVEVSSHLYQAGHEDKDANAGGGLSSQGNKELENSGAAFRSTSEREAKSSQNMSSISCKGSIDNGEKNLSTMDSVSRDFDDADGMIMPESSLGLQVVNIKKECLCVGQDGSNKKVLQKVEFTCKCGSISDQASPGNLSDSTNEISKLEETGNELFGIEVKEESGQNKQQNFQNSDETSCGRDCDNASHMIVPESSMESRAVKAKNGCLFINQDLRNKEGLHNADSACKYGPIHDEDSSGNLSNSINLVSGLENAVEDFSGIQENEDSRGNKQLVFQNCDETVHVNISSLINQNSGTGTSGEFLGIFVNEDGGGNLQRSLKSSCEGNMGKLVSQCLISCHEHSVVDLNDDDMAKENQEAYEAS